MKKSIKNSITGALITTSALGSGYAIHNQRELDAYIAATLAIHASPEREALSQQNIMLETRFQAFRKLAMQYQKEQKEGIPSADTVVEYRLESQRIGKLFDDYYGKRNYTGKEQDAKQQFDAVLSRLNVKRIIPFGITTLPGINASAHQTGKPGTEVAMSLRAGAADILTPDERDFIIDHEAAHVARHFTDKAGRYTNPLPTEKINGENVKIRDYNVYAETYKSLKREYDADKTAIRITCKPEEATSALATGVAIESGITPLALREHLLQGLKPTPLNFLRALADSLPKLPEMELSDDRKELMDYPHPNWKDRVAAIRAEAQVSCPVAIAK